MKPIYPFLFALCFFYTSAQNISPFIHVDQFGYLPNSSKVAVLSNPQVGFNSNLSYNAPASLEVRNALNDAVIYTGAPFAWNNGNTHEQSGDKGWWFDFSSIITEGDYYIFDAINNEQSATFSISKNSYEEVLKIAGRMFYYNRCTISKEETFAGKWNDEISFLGPLQDANCRYINDPNNANLEKELSGGWFDAGDYNKYVSFTVNTLHDMLSAYEENPEVFTDTWNIPESGNGIPDLIDEIIWELDWLLKMINSDGSVHNKMGSQNHDENAKSPPSANTDQRFYGPTCTSASTTIASVFSHAHKVLSQFTSLEPYADDLLEKSITTYNYALPFFLNNTLEADCDDGSIVAGDADRTPYQQLNDLIVASIYLFEETNNSTYNDFIIDNVNTLEQLSDSFWGPYYMDSNDALVLYSTLDNANTTVANSIITALTEDVSSNSNGYYGFSENDLYRAEIPNWSYHWGSNSPKASYGSLNQLVLNTAIFPDKEEDFYQYIDAAIHYFHGVNPLGLVYLSNMYDYGADRSIDEIYHTWFADGTNYDNAQTSSIGPPPGYVSGGPNNSFTISSLTPPYNQPDLKSYLDFNDGYPLNSWEISEPAIYYQASYLRLLANRVKSDDILSNNDYEPFSKFKMYPNPASKMINISGAISGDYLIIHNIIGSKINTIPLRNNGFDVSSLSTGLYFVSYRNIKGKEFKPQRLIIK